MSLPIGNGHSGDGRSTGQKMTPSPFVPNYSGDGQGRAAGWSGDGQASMEPQPIWSGGGRHDVHNPLMPTWGNTNGGHSNGAHMQGGTGQGGNTQPRFGQRASDHVAVSASAAPTREESPQSRQVPLSDDLVMNVNVPSGDGAYEPMKTARKSSGTWKLIALVVVFLVWVSTASTLLFLYMDRYLFP